MRNSLAPYIAGLAMLGAALAAPNAVAHQMAYPEGASDYRTSPAGVIAAHLQNNYDFETTFVIQVLDQEMTPIADDQWRSSFETDTVTLQPGEAIIFKVQLRTYGQKAHVCTRRAGVGMLSRICIRAWYR